MGPRCGVPVCSSLALPLLLRCVTNFPTILGVCGPCCLERNPSDHPSRSAPPACLPSIRDPQAKESRVLHTLGHTVSPAQTCLTHWSTGRQTASLPPFHTEVTSPVSQAAEPRWAYGSPCYTPHPHLQDNWEAAGVLLAGPALPLLTRFPPSLSMPCSPPSTPSSHLLLPNAPLSSQKPLVTGTGDFLWFP